MLNSAGSLIIPKRQITSIDRFKTGNKYKYPKFPDMHGLIVKTIDCQWTTNNAIDLELPKEYKKGCYGIKNIRVQTQSDFTLTLLLGGLNIEVLDSKYLLASDKDPLEPNTYKLDLTNRLILINLLGTFHNRQVSLVTTDPNAIIRYDIVHHNYKHIPVDSLINVKEYDFKIINGPIMYSPITGFCNQIHVWIKNASYVKLKLNRYDIWCILKLSPHPSEPDLWTYCFNYYINGNFKNSVSLSSADCYLETDAPNGTECRIRVDGYNIYSYSYSGQGRGKIGVRMSGLRFTT